MKIGIPAVCELTGFVPEQARACQEVARRLNCIIMFREPGKMAQRLIAESYAMKGFRIDTKSCDWGPMAGFVCADPRLSKGLREKQAFNAEYTGHALSGHIGGSFVHPDANELSQWKADVMPIVISQQRIRELEEKGVIHPQAARDGHLTGVADGADGSVSLPWRLVPVGNAGQPWIQRGLKVEPAPTPYFVLCINNPSFKQRYPTGAGPILFRGNETILGLTNPGNADTLGFKACVTADYDLFAIFPARDDMMSAMHKTSTAILNNLGRQPTNAVNIPVPRWGMTLPGGVPRLRGVDDRLRVTKNPNGPKDQRFEHFKHGDVSARVMTVKTMLNGAIIGAGYHGGNAVHHNDEAGNELLAKANVDECLPVVVFLPGSYQGAQTLALERPATKDFADFYNDYVSGRFVYRGKKSWAAAAGIKLTDADLQAAY